MLTSNSFMANHHHEVTFANHPYWRALSDHRFRFPLLRAFLLPFREPQILIANHKHSNFSAHGICNLASGVGSHLGCLIPRKGQFSSEHDGFTE